LLKAIDFELAGGAVLGKLSKRTGSDQVKDLKIDATDIKITEKDPNVADFSASEHYQYRTQVMAKTNPTKWFGDVFISDQDWVKCRYCEDTDVQKKDYDQHLGEMHSKKPRRKYNERKKCETII